MKTRRNGTIKIIRLRHNVVRELQLPGEEIIGSATRPGRREAPALLLLPPHEGVSVHPNKKGARRDGASHPSAARAGARGWPPEPARAIAGMVRDE